MRSATSYFNGTLYRKTMARYWPLWAGYGVIWFFLMPFNLLNSYLVTGETAWRLEDALQFPSYVEPGLYLAAFFAILCAMAVFGYLYNSRSACWFHALPMRREALFTTQYLAGLSFLLLPQLVTALLTAMVELAFLPMECWGQALGALMAWLLAQSGVCLFFFSFAAFCAMFTGHILALPAFYAILNVLADVIYTLIDSLMRTSFFGYSGSPTVYHVVNYLSPVSVLREAVGWWSSDGSPYFQSTPTIAAYAAVGVVLAFASLYVYRRRHAETAGDVVAIPLVRPLFKYGVSFCAGLCIGMFTTAFFGWHGMAPLIPCVLVWSVIGYFVAEMLLKKSFRVLKAWKGAVIMPVVLLALCLACYLDLFGVVSRVPGVDQVETLTVQLDMGYPSDSGSTLHITLTDPEDIQQFLDLHQAIADDWQRMSSGRKTFQAGNDYSSLRLWYTLKGGSSLNRSYFSLPLYREDLDKEGTVTNRIKRLCEDRELTAQAYGFEDFLKDRRLTGVWLDRVWQETGGPSRQLTYSVYVDGYIQKLWDAVQQDFAEGNIGTRYLFDLDKNRQSGTYMTDLVFGSEDLIVRNEDGSIRPTHSSSLSITLTPQAKHTLAVLEESGIWEQGYSLALRGEEDDSYYTSPAYYPEAVNGISEIIY